MKLNNLDKKLYRQHIETLEHTILWQRKQIEEKDAQIKELLEISTKEGLARLEEDDDSNNN